MMITFDDERMFNMRVSNTQLLVVVLMACLVVATLIPVRASTG
jgi:hypothetical protein